MRDGEKGNVLFLILIAVALFAALSYAVTQTSRSPNGTGGTDLKIRAAQVIQYPAIVRTAIMRMTINGVPLDDLEFNTPIDFADISNVRNAVFHPNGGSEIYNPGAADIMNDGFQGDWTFNMGFEIENIGLSAGSDLAGNDLVMFLPGIKRGICEVINEELGITGVPNSSVDLSSTYLTYMDDSYVLPSSESVFGSSASNGTDDLTGRPYGCFQNNSGDFVYYHVLAER